MKVSIILIFLLPLTSQAYSPERMLEILSNVNNRHSLLAKVIEKQYREVIHNYYHMHLIDHILLLDLLSKKNKKNLNALQTGIHSAQLFVRLLKGNDINGLENNLFAMDYELRNIDYKLRRYGQSSYQLNKIKESFQSLVDCNAEGLSFENFTNTSFVKHINSSFLAKNIITNPISSPSIGGTTHDWGPFDVVTEGTPEQRAIGMITFPLSSFLSAFSAFDDADDTKNKIISTLNSIIEKNNILMNNLSTTKKNTDFLIQACQMFLDRTKTSNEESNSKILSNFENILEDDKKNIQDYEILFSELKNDYANAKLAIKDYDSKILFSLENSNEIMSHADNFQTFYRSKLNQDAKVFYSIVKNQKEIKKETQSLAIAKDELRNNVTNLLKLNHKSQNLIISSPYIKLSKNKLKRSIK